MLPKILIVEDDAAIREIYLLKFELEGYTAAGAENGQAALDIVGSFGPDIILLDMMMPVMDGLEFMQQLSTRDCNADVIVFSNVSASEYIQEVKELGAVDFWVKSDYTPELVIDGITARWNQRQQLSS